MANVHQNGSWQWGKFSFILSQEVVDRIATTPIQLFGEKENTMTWKFSRDRDFNLASAYYQALRKQANSFPFMGRWVWELDMLPKIKHFFWLCHHGSILVRQVLNSKGISCNMGYPLCHKQEESIIHALRDYLVARKFSLSMGVPQALANFLCLNLLDWLKANSMCSSHIKANGMPWSVQFPFAIWYLWKHRNWTTFENTPINPKVHQVCVQEAKEYYYCVGKRQKLKHRIVTPVC